MSAQIKFGTSGWRAIVADEFTVANVRRAVTGIARYVAAKNPGRGRIIVGRDPRYMGERFVEIASEILTSFSAKPMGPSTLPLPTIRRSTTASNSLRPTVRRLFRKSQRPLSPWCPRTVSMPALLRAL